MSCGGSKARYAMILFVLVCSAANANSISSLSDTSASRYRSAQVPSHQHAARLTGVSPFFIPSSWSEPRPRTDSARFLHLYWCGTCRSTPAAVTIRRLILCGTFSNISSATHVALTRLTETADELPRLRFRYSTEETHTLPVVRLATEGTQKIL